MKEVRVRGVRLGHGRPKICLPLMGVTREELISEAKESLSVPCDIIEWRVDYFNEVTNHLEVLETAQTLRGVLAEKPLIFTFRSAREGGVRELSDEAYFSLYQAIIPTGLVDIVDLELMMPENKLTDTVTLAKAQGVFVLMCHHNFKETPAKEVMETYLKMMESQEADICKLAVMPQTPKDVLKLLEVTEAMRNQLSVPLVTMSMGKLGKVSRVTGELFGSAMTFGTVGEASAPGQFPVEELVASLKLFTCDV